LIQKSKRYQFHSFVQYFGTNSRKTSAAVDPIEQHRLFQQQLMELQEERTSLYGFTEEDHVAWSQQPQQQQHGGGFNHCHDPALMTQIEQARQRQSTETSMLLSADKGHVQDQNSTMNKLEKAMTSASTAIEQQHPSATLTHVSADGQTIQMVDVSDKAITDRIAVAESRIIFPPLVMTTLKVYRSTSTETLENHVIADDLIGTKGPIFATAKVAGIMAAKYVIPFPSS
jgi:hypothetical protein